MINDDMRTFGHLLKHWDVLLVPSLRRTLVWYRSRLIFQNAIQFYTSISKLKIVRIIYVWRKFIINKELQLLPLHTYSFRNATKASTLMYQMLCFNKMFSMIIMNKYIEYYAYCTGVRYVHSSRECATESFGEIDERATHLRSPWRCCETELLLLKRTP